MLATNPDLATRMKSNRDRMIELVGVHSKIARARLDEVDALFESEEANLVPGNQTGEMTPEQTARSSKHH